MRKGFTLFELLVVVLIIGILAAIALPQYQVAVLKARYMQAVSLGSALRQAQDIYYMANGKYSVDLRNLDISVPVPSDCTISPTGAYMACPDFACVVYDEWENTEKFGSVYCALRKEGNPYLYYDASPRWKEKRYCQVSLSAPEYELAKKVCISSGGVYEKTIYNSEYYLLP